MSFIERMRQAAKEMEAPPPDPWKKALSDALKDVQGMSTVCLLGIVGARHNTSNARRLAAVMRELRFVPTQSRRLEPGGHRSTVARGWVRPMRSLPISEKVKPRQGTTSPPSNLTTTEQERTIR
jgi:hypothetical protein